MRISDWSSDVCSSDLTILAEPNLTAVTGETASFLAGGEFTIPVSQDEDTITVIFKQFGVSLAFTPTPAGRSRLSMRVSPDGRQLDRSSVVTGTSQSGSVSRRCSRSFKQKQIITS